MASSLLRIRYWNETPISHHKFLLFATGKNKGDKNLSWDHIERDINDGKGNYYYTSYPPFAYIAPYITFRLFKIEPTVFSLRIFSIIIHLLCCLLIFLILLMLTGISYKNKINLPAIIGFSVYLFSLLPYWYHSMRFYSDTFVQLFFIAGIYLFLKILQNTASKLYLSLFSTTLFLMCYTEWLGFLFALSVMLYALFTIKKRGMKSLFFVTGITSAIALITLLLHYSLITNFRDLFYYLLAAYKKRCGVSPGTNNEPLLFSKKSWKSLFRTYFFSYKEFLLFIYTTTSIAFFGTKFDRNFIKENKNKLIVLYLALLPVILHHLILFNLTVIHEFLFLKTGIFFALLAGISYEKVETYIRKHAAYPRLKLGVLLTLFVFSFVQAIRMHSWHNIKHSSCLKTIGSEIEKNAKPDEMVFIKYHPNTVKLKSKLAYMGSGKLGPGCCWYANRNIATWLDRDTTENMVKINGLKKYIVFSLNKENSKIINIGRQSI
jgi:hypothetical protein